MFINYYTLHLLKIQLPENIEINKPNYETEAYTYVFLMNLIICILIIKYKILCSV